MTAAGRIEILDDTLTVQAFSEAVSRVSGMPAVERVRSGASLGVIMVLAHASVLAAAGEDVFVLMDDGDGRRRAKAEQNWLAERAAGRLTLWSTPQVLRPPNSPAGSPLTGSSTPAVGDRPRRCR